MKLAFIGLGVMGGPMAGHLAKAGHELTVYNRTFAKAAAWVETYGGKAAETPADAAKDAEIVFACVGNDDDLRQVTTGMDGAFPSMKAGSIFVDHTTASAMVARELSVAAGQRGLNFLDAPITGGQSGAQQGQLSIMIGGDATIFGQVEPILKTYGKSIVLMGPSGSGQLAKMVNQICIVGIFEGLAEGLAFAKRAGLDTEKLLGAISKGLAQSWLMEHRSRTMLNDQFDFGFAVDWMIKDMSICLDEAARNGAKLPLAATIKDYLIELSNTGHGKLDVSSLIKRLYDFLED